jgi:hypothetical protein
VSELTIEHDGCVRIVRVEYVSNRVTLALSIPISPLFWVVLDV